ncbi:hypothetical protein ACH40F_07780 [Streptomyces sp. NPDC020794]|uniref:hypothetical protein n=1 Tax=unclassified Streptomyces TaxID=2593676 RepID=UPI0036EE690E
MPLISSLVDDFNDGVVDPVKWPDSFGAYSEVGGRARVSCDPGFNAYSSGTVYTLAGSAVFLRVYPPAAGGSTGEAWTQVLVKADVSGTDIAFEVDAVNGLLKCMSRTGFFDPSTVAVTYNAVAHAWLRVREAGGNVVWETSPNAATWTVQRTLATPGWVTTGTDLEFQLIAHRSDGIVDFAEFDNVNGTGTFLALGTASETDTALTLGRTKTRALGTAVETDTALALTATIRRPITDVQASETDTGWSATSIPARWNATETPGSWTAKEGS